MSEKHLSGSGEKDKWRDEVEATWKLRIGRLRFEIPWTKDPFSYPYLRCYEFFFLKVWVFKRPQTIFTVVYLQVYYRES